MQEIGMQEVRMLEEKTLTAEKGLTMEEAFDRLNALLNRMEREEHTLEETFSLYEEGLKLVRCCSEKIDGIEKKLVILEEGMADDSGRDS